MSPLANCFLDYSLIVTLDNGSIENRRDAGATKGKFEGVFVKGDAGGPLRNIGWFHSVVGQVPKRKENEMTASSNAGHHATEAAKETSEEVSEIARDVSRKAGRQFARAKNMASDAYEEAHEASKEYPHVTLALAAGFGFLLGVLAARR
jgi:ElaB/YqjD/DUF883 family membrane-anchored ribosome-binding protein